MKGRRALYGFDGLKEVQWGDLKEQRGLVLYKYPHVLFSSCRGHLSSHVFPASEADTCTLTQGPPKVEINDLVGGSWRLSHEMLS